MTKIEAARQEYADWCSAVGVDSLGKVNEILEEGKALIQKQLDEWRSEKA